MVNALIIWGTARLFFKASVPFYIPTWSVWGFWFLHILTNTWNFILAVIVSVQWCLIVVWFVFPWWLMMSSMFSCYWPCVYIYIYWKNTCSDPFPTLKIGLFVFIISGKSLLYKPFMSKWFANIFTHSMGCLFYFIDDRIPELLFYLSIDLELVPPPLSKQSIKNSVFLRGRKWDEWFSISLIPLPFILYRTEKRQMVERELLQLFFVVTLLAFLFQEFLSNFGL